MNSLDLVRSFSVPTFIVKKRRQRAAKRIVRNGRRLSQVQRHRAGITEINEWTEVDAATLDKEIRRLERLRQRDITYLQTTPAL